MRFAQLMSAASNASQIWVHIQRLDARSRHPLDIALDRLNFLRGLDTVVFFSGFLRGLDALAFFFGFLRAVRAAFLSGRLRASETFCSEDSFSDVSSGIADALRPKPKLFARVERASEYFGAVIG